MSTATTGQVKVAQYDEERNKNFVSIHYTRGEDGRWYVDAGDGFEQFAVESARVEDVEQLIRKEYDDRY